MYSNCAGDFSGVHSPIDLNISFSVISKKGFVSEITETGCDCADELCESVFLPNGSTATAALLLEASGMPTARNVEGWLCCILAAADLMLSPSLASDASLTEPGVFFPILCTEFLNLAPVMHDFIFWRQ